MPDEQADDQEIVIVGADGTEHVFPAGFNPKRAAAIVRGGSATLPTRPVSAEDFTPPSSSWPAKIGDVAIGALKGVGSTAAGLGEMAVNAGMVPGSLPAAFLPSEFRNPLFQKTDELTTATNTPQRIGKVIEQGAEMLLPTGAAGKAAVEAIPTAAKAGAKFQSVMAAAKDVPISVAKPGAVAMRIQELADRGGGSMPRPVAQFLKRITDPAKGSELPYEEARDFASGISRLSRDEFNRLSPVVQREVGNMRVVLNKAVADAAGKAGKGVEYAEAMKEYAQAMKIRNAINGFYEGMQKKAIPYAVGGAAAGAAAGSWLSKHVGALWGGD